MKASGLGYVVASVLFILPFLVSQSLFYSAANLKVLCIALVTDLMLGYIAYQIFSGQKTLTYTRRWLPISVAVLLGVHTLSALLGVFPALSFWSDLSRSTGILWQVHLALFALILGTYLEAVDWALVRRAIIVSAAIVSLLMILGTEGLGVPGQFLWINLQVPGLTFSNGTFAGAYLLLAFIIGCIEYVRLPKASTVRRVVGGALVLTALSPTLFNTGLLWGRGLSDLFSNPELVLGTARASSVTLAAFLVFMGGYLLIRRFLKPEKSRRAVATFALVFITLLMVGIGLLFTPGSPVQNAYIETSSAARIYVWEGAWDAFLERPIFGWGPETFETPFALHFNNELFMPENYGEIWFDRAHNIILDTLVSVGSIGALALIACVFFCVRAVVCASRRNSITEVEAVLLLTLPIAHFMQLQTAFDTPGTYVLCAVLVGYAIFLERQEPTTPLRLPEYGRYALAGTMGILALASLIFYVGSEWVRQLALKESFASIDDARQQEALRTSLTRTSSFEALRLSSASLIAGGLQKVATSGGDPQTVNAVMERLTIFEEAYQRLLADYPHHYRARVNYAYLLLVKTALGEDRRQDAIHILEDSYVLSPQNPLTHALHAVAVLYEGDVRRARELMAQAKALNEDAPFTKDVDAYIIRQITELPEISLLKLENL